MKSDPLAIHEGGCLCGDVRYRVMGEPVRTQACHCTFCQRFTGSAFYVESLFPKERVAFEGSPLQVYEHVSDGSGHRIQVRFCPRCGTTVSLTFDRFPTVQAISRGTFDDPDWVTPGAQLFTRSAQSGVALPSGQDCFETHRIGLDGSPSAPMRHEAPVMSALRAFGSDFMKTGRDAHEDVERKPL